MQKKAGIRMLARDKLLFAIDKCEKELVGQNRYPLIPTIVHSLRKMLLEIDKTGLDSKYVPIKFDGLGKIVTDNIYFLESDIGKAVLDAMNEYRKIS